KNLHQLYIPPGCAHGFCVTSEMATFLYKCTAYYSPMDERGILWNDPALGIRWPISEPILSPKDQAYRTIKEMDPELPVYTPIR
ncbi:MAG: dTDP-4-dehydrorhamnose 3,5-epimerase family protein, partial [Nitrospira sp.]